MLSIIHRATYLQLADNSCKLVSKQKGRKMQINNPKDYYQIVEAIDELMMLFQARIDMARAMANGMGRFDSFVLFMKNCQENWENEKQLPKHLDTYYRTQALAIAAEEFVLTELLKIKYKQ